jgi:hypothetical protein
VAGLAAPLDFFPQYFLPWYFRNGSKTAITQVLQWSSPRLDTLDMYGIELSSTNGDAPWTCNWKAWKNDKPQETKSTG